MAIGLTEEHEALAASVRAFAARDITPKAVRDADAGFWPALAAQGLPGLHLPEDAGGQGFGILEQAVALEELGRAMAPGVYTPTVLASAVLHAAGGDVRGLADGSRTGAIGLSGSLARDGDTVTGTIQPVLGAPLADLFVLPVGDGWVVLGRDDVTVGPLESLDVTRPVGSVTVDGVTVPDERLLGGSTRTPSQPSSWGPRPAVWRDVPWTTPSRTRSSASSSAVRSGSSRASSTSAPGCSSP